MRKKPTWTPKCPTCGEKLEGCGFPLPSKGRGRCPVGQCTVGFEAEVDTEKVVKDKDGNAEPSVGWKVTGGHS